MSLALPVDSLDDSTMPPSACLTSSSLALLTDLYELTMSQAYFKNGMRDTETVFNLFFREIPFSGGFAVACGLADAVEFIENFRFTSDDIAYLSTLNGNDGRPLFDPEFLDWLFEMRLTLSIDAVPEGNLVFAHEPLLRVQGPIIQCQIVESALLNIVNFQTLIATKAARITQAAGSQPVMEFGLRRAQGINGAIAACRASYAGGCVGTSNVLAGKLLGIPVMGTHAHSWVMAFEHELDAFQAYAGALPNNCIFLVDTYDSLEGVRHAIAAGNKLKERGHKLAGIRLDSGDLAWLSIEARKLLDAAGFPDAVIVGSNDLDEHIIHSLKEQGAMISVWGVGTRLVTAFDEPALGGVYKITAIRRPGEPWQDRIKLSERAVKTTIPGLLRVRRYRTREQLVADVIYDERIGVGEPCTIVDPMDPTRRKTIPAGTEGEDVLVPVIREGKLVEPLPALEEIRARAAQEIGLLHPAIKRFVKPHEFPVGLEQRLADRRMNMIMSRTVKIPDNLIRQPHAVTGEKAP